MQFLRQLYFLLLLSFLLWLKEKRRKNEKERERDEKLPNLQQSLKLIRKNIIGSKKKLHHIKAGLLAKCCLAPVLFCYLSFSIFMRPKYQNCYYYRKSGKDSSIVPFKID